MFHATLLVAALALLAAPALAATSDGPIATGNGADPTVATSSTSAPPLAVDDAADNADGGQRVVMGPCGPTQATPDGKPDKAAHGEVEAGIGTSGYRHVAATVCKPIGDGGAVTLSAGTTSFNGGGGRR